MTNFDPTRILSDERFGGKRADYHVYPLAWMPNTLLPDWATPWENGQS